MVNNFTNFTSPTPGGAAIGFDPFPFIIIIILLISLPTIFAVLRFRLMPTWKKQEKERRSIIDEIKDHYVALRKLGETDIVITEKIRVFDAKITSGQIFFKILETEKNQPWLVGVRNLLVDLLGQKQREHELKRAKEDAQKKEAFEKKVLEDAKFLLKKEIHSQKQRITELKINGKLKELINSAENALKGGDIESARNNLRDAEKQIVECASAIAEIERITQLIELKDTSLAQSLRERFEKMKKNKIELNSYKEYLKKFYQNILKQK